ncbi:hypothetical protein K1719_020232 [Acacia pycnantha]|nr:hypothetical protein K1719_020232 [Acacia pycnantha]
MTDAFSSKQSSGVPTGGFHRLQRSRNRKTVEVGVRFSNGGRRRLRRRQTAIDEILSGRTTSSKNQICFLPFYRFRNLQVYPLNRIRTVRTFFVNEERLMLSHVSSTGTARPASQDMQGQSTCYFLSIMDIKVPGSARADPDFLNKNGSIYSDTVYEKNSSYRRLPRLSSPHVGNNNVLKDVMNRLRGAGHGIAASRGDAKLNAAGWMSENMGGLRTMVKWGEKEEVGS